MPALLHVNRLWLLCILSCTLTGKTVGIEDATVAEKDVVVRKRKADMLGESPLNKIRRNTNSEGPDTDYYLVADEALRLV